MTAIDNSNTSVDPSEFHYITLLTFGKRKVFITPAVNDIACAALAHHAREGNIALAGYVVMPDHIHIVARPLAMSIPVFVNNFKAYTGIKVKAELKFTKRIWKKRFFDVEIKDAEDLAARLEQMHFNPVKQKLAKTPEEFPWSSCKKL